MVIVSEITTGVWEKCRKLVLEKGCDTEEDGWEKKTQQRKICTTIKQINKGSKGKFVKTSKLRQVLQNSWSEIRREVNEVSRTEDRFRYVETLRACVQWRLEGLSACQIHRLVWIILIFHYNWHKTISRMQILSHEKAALILSDQGWFFFPNSGTANKHIIKCRRLCRMDSRLPRQH